MNTPCKSSDEKFCQDCGALIKVNAHICPNCGVLQTNKHNLKSKGIAICLALFLGGFGGHRFYLGKPFSGILYFLFSWTLIPACLAIIECIILLFMSEESFNRAWNN